MTSGVITIVIVALLTGGYSLTALLWFACPSIVFRQEYIFIPAASCSVFGFIGTAWALIISTRYQISAVSCPITISLTLGSALLYGGLAVYTRRRIRQMTRSASWPAQPSWQDAGYYSPYASSTYPLAAAQSIASERASVNYSIHQPGPTEDELVNQQMATLLTKVDPRPSPDATQSTFRLEWPVEEDEDGAGRQRRRAFTAHGPHLAPEDAKSRSTLSKIGQAIRGRLPVREGVPTERAKSREERRQEIEMGHMSQ